MTNTMKIANQVVEVIGNATAKEVEKANGVVLTGITVQTDGTNVFPTIYIDEMVEDGLTVDEIAEKVKKVAEEHAKPSLDTSVIESAEYAREHLRARLYNKATNAEIFRSAEQYGFEDLIIVPYLDLDEVMKGGCIKVNKQLLNLWGMTAEECLEIAEENSRQETKVQSMAEIMAEMIGMELPEPDEDTPQMIVVSNDSKMFGAYSIIPLLDYFKAKYPEGFAVLPSSVHEVIVVTTDDPMLDGMVQDVNTTQVDLKEQLSDHAYRFVA